MGSRFLFVGAAMFVLMVVYEFGWPPIEMFDTLLRTEKSRTIARVVGWVLTAALLIGGGFLVWSTWREF